MLDVTVTTADGREALVHTESLSTLGSTIDDALLAELFDVLLERFRSSAADPDYRHCPSLRGAIAPNPVLTFEDDGFLWGDVAVLCAQPRCLHRARAYEAWFDHPNAARLRRLAVEYPGLDVG